MNGWKRFAREVTPYIPGEQPSGSDIVKLNTNENPWPPSPEVERILKTSPAEALRLYPDPSMSELVRAIADAKGLKENQVYAGVGSDEILAMSFLAFFNGTVPVLFPDITYSFYDVWADLFRIPYRQIPVDENFCIRTEDYACENGGIVFANPNAPTGVALPLSDVRWILSQNPDVCVIVDEAYVDFGGRSAIELLDEFDNLLVVQTFSKSRSLPGLRIGYACGSADMISCLSAVRNAINSYTLNRLSIEAGAAAVKDDAWYRQTCAAVVRTREWTKNELARLGFSFPDSRTNFIFASHPDIAAGSLFEALRSQGIYVRHFSGPRIDNYLRITVGKPEEMAKLIRCLEKLVRKT